MNEKFSALLDGELNRDEAAKLIKVMSANDAQRECWDTYHLIGDALRGQVGQRECNIEMLFARLAQEPTVLAPPAAINRHSSTERKTRIALAMAASVATVSVIGMVAMRSQQGASIAPVQLVQQVPPKAVTGPTVVNVNDYLAIHRQFANPNAMQQVAVRGGAQ